MIFINYRIADTHDVVARLDDSLREVFGAESVFRDKTGIDGGANWPDELDRHAGSCAAMLVVIGRAWTDVSFASGPFRGFPRLFDSSDWVRREIDIAFKADTPIIPVFVNGGQMPEREWLATVGLEGLFKKQGIRINTDTYATDVHELIELIQKVAPHCVIRPRSKGTESTLGLRLGMQKLDQGRMLVGCCPYPPLMDWDRHSAVQNKNDEFFGPWVDLFRRSSIIAGIGYEIALASAPDFAETVIARVPFEVVLGLFKTDRRAQEFEFSAPMHRIGLQGVCKAGAPFITKEALAQGDLRIVVQDGEVGWEYVNRELTSASRKGNVYTMKGLATYETMDLMLSGRYDLAITDEISCLHFLRGLGEDRGFRLAFERPLQMFDACLAVRKGVRFDIEAFQQVMLTVRNEPAFLIAEVAALRGFERIIERCGLR